MKKIEDKTTYQLSLDDILELLKKHKISDSDINSKIKLEPFYTRKEYDGPGFQDRDVAGFMVVVEHPVQ